MRAGLIMASLGAAAVAVMPADGIAVAALDNEQFCSAMSEIARLGNANAGNWIDRNTRDDGVEVVCRIRTVNYKRFMRSNPAAPDWRASCVDGAFSGSRLSTGSFSPRPSSKFRK